MFKNTEISIWDLLVYLMSGGLLLILIALHLIIYGINVLKILSLMNASTVLIVLPSVSFIVGLLIEPLANKFEKEILNKIRKKFKFRTCETDIKSDYYTNRQKLAKGLISQELTDNEVYHFCKDFIIQKSIPSPFMAFLSKFGFYRNAEFIFYLNAGACTVQVFHLGCKNLLLGIILTLGSIVCAKIFGDRAMDFYGHMTGTVYNNFIAANKEKTDTQQGG